LAFDVAEPTESTVRGRARHARRRRGRRIARLCVTAAAVVSLVVATVWATTTASTRTTMPGEAVVNGAAASSLSGWRASSDAGAVRLVRLRIGDGPYGETTAVDVQREDADGEWATALADLHDPAAFFEVGRTYRMQVYVRDLRASGADVGLLLADDNYAHRPTSESVYESFQDDEWHLLTMTFVCTQPASADTALYIALPESGPLHWQMTAASVHAVDDVRPPHVEGDPTTVISFPGPAGAPPDPDHWNHELGGHGWGNDELQTYTDSVENARQDGSGNLVVTARREDATGPDGIERDYTSARLTTEGKVEVQPGSYVEATIRPPVGEGVWPAFWLIGTNNDRVGWPASGELDVLEVDGGNPTLAHSRIHTASRSDPDRDIPYGAHEPGGTVDLGHPLDGQPHRYGVYFDGAMVRFYIDREEHLALDADDAFASGRSWPFGKPQYLVLNVAVGGIAGDPSDTSFPRAMTVGPVSIWEGGTPF
jgi:hypothetical protein